MIDGSRDSRIENRGVAACPVVGSFNRKSRGHGECKMSRALENIRVGKVYGG